MNSKNKKVVAKNTKNKAKSKQDVKVKAKQPAKKAKVAAKNVKAVSAKVQNKKETAKKVVKAQKSPAKAVKNQKVVKDVNKSAKTAKSEKLKVSKEQKNAKNQNKVQQNAVNVVESFVQEDNVVDIRSALDKKKNLEVIKKYAESKQNNKALSFKVGNYAVYPSHGVGKIADIESINIGGQDFSCYLMFFEQEKLTIKIPVSQAKRIGLRTLSSKEQIEEVFTVLRSGVKKLKGMWSRRAQEYEAKINSGDIMMLAEVLRDLTRDIEDGERSYSERIIYETAIYRLSSEYAAIYGVSFEEAKTKVVAVAKDKLGSFDQKVKSQDDDFDFDDEFDSAEDDEELLEDEDDGEDDDFEDDEDDGSSRKRSARK